jgi:hypothetical protein
MCRDQQKRWQSWLQADRDIPSQITAITARLVLCKGIETDKRYAIKAIKAAVLCLREAV